MTTRSRFFGQVWPWIGDPAPPSPYSARVQRKIQRLAQDYHRLHSRMMAVRSQTGNN
jgi:hypothetical protein